MLSFDCTSTASPEGGVVPKASSTPAPPQAKGLSLLAFSSCERKLTLQQHISVPCADVGQLRVLAPIEHPPLYAADLRAGCSQRPSLFLSLSARDASQHTCYFINRNVDNWPKSTYFSSAAHKSSRGRDHDQQTMCLKNLS